jgi:dTDP-6-deoxy-L-talose 4-dehydrogenase (NAD+)
MSLVVTGAGGFVGRHLRRLLEAAPDPVDVVTIDHRWSDPAELGALLPGRIDACIHLGWSASGPGYLTDEEGNAASLAASVGLLGLLVARGCGHLVVAGTCAEYAPSDSPVSEDAALAPTTAYGRAKLALFEQLSGSPIPFAWARLFNVIGPGDGPGRLMPTVASALAAGTAVALSPSDQRRDYIDVDDVAGAVAALSAKRVVGAVNVCRGEPVRQADFLRLLATSIGADPDLLEFGQRPYGSFDPPFLVGVPSRARQVLPSWRPTHDEAAMARRIVNDVVHPGAGR